MKSMTRMVVFAAFMALLGCGGDSDPAREASTASLDEGTIKIGLLQPFSGTLVCAGNYRKAAAEMAAYEINSSGGLFGRPIEIVAEDTESDPTQAVTAAQRLADQGADFVIGAAISDSTLQVARQVTIPRGVLQIAPSSTSPEISSLQDDGLVWRLAQSDEAQGRVAANYVAGEYGGGSAGIIFIDSAYGRGLAQSFKEEFESQGGTVLAYIDYPAMTNEELVLHDFSAEISELFADSPEVIYLVSYYMDGAKITQAMKPYITETYAPLLVGVDGNYGSVFKSNADPDVVEGMIGTIPVLDETRVPYRKFKTNYETLFGVSPTLYSESTYDAVYVLAYAMLLADSTDPIFVKQYMREATSDGEIIGVSEFDAARTRIEDGIDIDYSGASGEIEFKENGDISTGSYIIWQMSEGAYTDIASGSLQESQVILESWSTRGLAESVDRYQAGASFTAPIDSYSMSGEIDFCR